MDTLLSGTAFSMGFLQMFIRTQSDIDVSIKNMVILGTITSILWVIYQYRKNGITNITTVYTSTGLIVQLYILTRILHKERQEIKQTNLFQH